MKLEEIQDKLKEFLNDTDCYEHCVRVKDMCNSLAKQYGLDVYKAEIAGLLHDCARKHSADELIYMAEDLNIPITEVILTEPHNILHSFIGALVAEQTFNITDQEVLSAIKHHTMGASEMGLLGKIVFIADKIEPARNYEDVDKLRKLVYEDLDSAILMTYDIVIKELLETKKIICDQIINARNKILFHIQTKTKIL